MKQQLVGHVSEDTAYIVNNYFLNKVQTPIRYWVETKFTYGQRVIKQLANTRTGGWFKPKPLTTYSNIVVMYHDPDEVYPQHNFTSNKEPVETQSFNLSFIQEQHLQAFRAYYAFDKSQLLIIDEHILDRKITKLDTQTEELKTPHMTNQPNEPVAKRSPGRPVKEDPPELIAIKLERERVKLQREQAALHREELKNKAIEQALLARSLKLKDVPDAEPAKPIYNWLSEQDCKDVEEAYGFKMLPPKVIKDETGRTIGCDMAYEESQRANFTDFVEYCINNPRFAPTRMLQFRNRAERLNIDISMLPYATGIQDVRSIHFGQQLDPITQDAFYKNGKEKK